jgi:phosphotransferase system enzyme I (PtsI)
LADRDNPKVSHLCQPLAPAVLQVLSQVIAHCRAANKQVTLCGEMAGQPKAFILLFGMGLRSFSMSPAFIPSMKELAAQLTQVATTQILREILGLKTTSQVKRSMTRALESIAPHLAVLDSN